MNTRLPDSVTFGRSLKLMLALAVGLGLALTFADQVWAEEAPAASAKSDNEGGLFTSMRKVSMPPLLAPMTTGGRLHYYYFLDIELVVRGGDLWRVREMIPSIQDALVEEVHGASLSVDGDPEHVAKDRLSSQLLTRAQAVAGDDTVLGLRILRVVRGLP